MKNIKYYNMYMFISTFTRNIIDIYSVVYLYQKFVSIRSILGIYIIVYFLGAIISAISITLSNKIGTKHILFLSSIITGITFYLIHNTNNEILISIFLSLSIFTYHPIKHYYGIKLLKDKQKIGNTIILTYLAAILSSYIAIKKINYIYLILITIISVIPILFIKKDKQEIIIYPKEIPKNKIIFFIFDQTKILFLLLEPLYLYIISNNIKYVGIFNIIIAISSIIFLYIFINKNDIEKHYKIINIIFVITLLFKININNKIFLLIIAIIEGIGIKINEVISTMNLYQNKENNIGYLIISEIIFCLVRSLLLLIIFILKLNFKTIMYVLLTGIFILSFTYKKDTIKVSNS